MSTCTCILDFLQYICIPLFSADNKFQLSTHTCRQTLNTACCHISKLHQVKVVKNTALKVIHVLSIMLSVFRNVVLKNNPSYLMYYLQYNHCSWDFFSSLPLTVVLQAIVYSLLLLFIHPRPEPRTKSLVETVCINLC